MTLCCSSTGTTGIARSILLGVTLLLGSVSAADDPPGSPSLRLGANDEDFGVLLQGQSIDRQIVIHNDGQAPLNIHKASPSCGCTTIKHIDREIAPGESGVIAFSVNSKKIKPGDTLKRVTIESNDPRQPKVLYHFTAGVVALYKSRPQTIRIRGIYHQPKEARIDLVANSQFGFELLGLRSRGGLFEVVELEEVEFDRHYRVLLRVPPAAAPLNTRDPLDFRIQTRDGQIVEVGQWVEIEHWDSLHLQPPEVVQFGNRDTDRLLPEGASPVTKSVSLVSRDESLRFQVLGARVEGFPEGVFEVSVQELQPARSYTVTVSLLEYRSETFLRGKLIIETDAPIDPVRSLHLRAKFGKR